MSTTHDFGSISPDYDPGQDFDVVNVGSSTARLCGTYWSFDRYDGQPQTRRSGLGVLDLDASSPGHMWVLSVCYRVEGPPPGSRVDELRYGCCRVALALGVVNDGVAQAAEPFVVPDGVEALPRAADGIAASVFAMRLASP